MAYLIAAPLLFVSVLLWAYRCKSKISYLGLLGGTNIFLAYVTHQLYPKVYSIALGGLQPTVDQNSIVHFFYLHGISFGTLALAIAIGLNYVSSKSA